jgi:sortase A
MARRILVILGLVLIGLWFKNDTQARVFRSGEAMNRGVTSARGLRQSPGRLFEGVVEPITLESGVFGRIEIPRLGMSALIAEGTTTAQLDRAVGHIAATAFPGQPGNCALAGHRDSFLRGLGELRENDVIHIDTLQGTYTYEVEWSTVVEPRRVDVLDTTPTPSLTLVTCYPFHYVGPAPERFVVRARLVSPAPVSGTLEDHGAFQSEGLTAEGR